MHQRGQWAKEDLTENESCVMKLSLTVAMNLNRHTHSGAAREEGDDLRGLELLDL